MINLAEVTKSYGSFTALKKLNLGIAKGEFFTLLGPSGSGKTTTLRLISGFEQPDSGRIEINGQDVANRPPYERNVNTVFQDYALFPHMTVAENIAYGLEAKKIPAAEVKTRTRDALDMVRLGDLAGRKPGQLSGGQKQRVALARAVVNRPDVLLLDEPLGALDLKLRHEMQIELKSIHNDLGITFVYVTHDQEEALTMSDRIAVFNHGEIVQIGAPSEIYERPRNEYVAKFIGLSNILTRGGKTILVRPEKISISDQQTGNESGVIADVIYLGMMTRFIVTLDSGETLSAVELNSETRLKPRFAAGQRVWLGWDTGTAHSF